MGGGGGGGGGGGADQSNEAEDSNGNENCSDQYHPKNDHQLLVEVEIVVQDFEIEAVSLITGRGGDICHYGYHPQREYSP